MLFRGIPCTGHTQSMVNEDLSLFCLLHYGRPNVRIYVLAATVKCDNSVNVVMIST